MESLSYYLKGIVSKELQDSYTAVLSSFDTFGVDIHITMIDSLLATADDRDPSEVLAFLDSILFDQVNAILMAHRIDAYPTTVPHAFDYLNALNYYQSVGGDEMVYGILQSSDNTEDTWGELVAYVNNTQAEAYLEEIRRVDPEALGMIQAVADENAAVEDDDYDDDSADDLRQKAVPWVRVRLLVYRNHNPDPTVVVTRVVHNNLKLGLPVSVLWSSVGDEVLDTPETQWAHEVIMVAMASRMEDQEIKTWVMDTLAKHTDNPEVTRLALNLLHPLG
jgi:hypothetical protein